VHGGTISTNSDEYYKAILRAPVVNMNERKFALGSFGQCQHPTCLNQGRMRLQRRSRGHAGRYLYLCSQCLEALLPIQLTDLFARLGKPIETAMIRQ
jgi:hypothetical protein